MVNLTTSQIIAIVVGILIIVFLLYMWLRPKTTVSTTKVTPANTNPVIPGPTGNASVANVRPQVQPPVSAASGPYVLYYFYSPNCVYCKNLKPIWDNVATTAKNITIKDNKTGVTYPLITREIDTSLPANESLASYYNVNAVPVIILVTPEKTVEYNGAREQTAIESFVTSNI
jgi:thiol-disulfide isomerase/thioredoxin